MTGTTLNLSYIQCPNLLTIHTPSDNSKDLLQITNNGEVYYRYNDEMLKVNCPDDVTEALTYTVLNYNNSSIEDILFNKYLNKISTGQITNEQTSMLENVFRKLKIQKLNDNR